MNYYLVVPLAGTSRHASGFTYHSKDGLKPGSLVKVPLLKKQEDGLIIARVTKPEFKTRPITQLVMQDALPDKLLQLAQWLSAYYATPLGSIMRMLIPSRPDLERPYTQPKVTKLSRKVAKLHSQQRVVIDSVIKSSKSQFLLHGATGSGKTQVYIELARHYLAKGQSSIVLVPEIALTSQAIDHFTAIFKDQVIVTHSGLTSMQRRAIWQHIRTSQRPLIVIGPRSALFSPFKNLGLVVVDEAHEPSYKQDQSPRYHSVPVAAKLASLHGAKLLLGSATPSIQDIFLAEQGRLQLLSMPERINRHTAIEVEVVDMRKPELRRNHSYLSIPLIQNLRETLDKQQQSILFINRRGSASQLACAHCGFVVNCPNCHIPLTFHADQGKLRCHWCNYNQLPPAICPECARLELRFLGIGTKRLESDVKSLLPSARVARLDRDSLDTKDLNVFMERLHSGEIDILIGTQMVAKGLDIPSVTLVGIILADSSLYIPDFTASERTFQLLHQVSGRAGRRDNLPAKTIIQTYSPDHPAIKAVQDHDFLGFSSRELEERRLLNYPPYVYLLKLWVTRASRQSAVSSARSLALQLPQKGIELLGPAPAFRETLGGKFTWQLIVKSRSRKPLLEIVSNLPANWNFDLDPSDLL